MKLEKVYTKQAPEAIGPYSQAIKAGEMVYTSGQIAICPTTGKIEAQDIQGQTKQVMENLSAVLAAAGSSMESVVKTVCYLADMADFAAFNAVYGTYLKNCPARSCVAVRALPKSALVEVEVIAKLAAE